MNTFLSLVPVALMLVSLVSLYAGLAKLAARLYRRTHLPWRLAFQFGGWVTLLVILAGMLRVALPQWVTALVGLGAVVLFGAWFLGRRARTAAGETLGTRGAAVLSVITVGLSLAVGIALTLLLFALGPR